MEWRSFPQFEDRYEVSNTGLVRRRLNLRVKKPTIHINGYLTVSVRCTFKSHTRYIHRAVLEAFVGPCPAGLECAHLDSNPQNNHVNNLKWVTPLENAGHRITRGTSGKGSQNSMAKLNENQVQFAKFLLSMGAHAAYVADFFNVSVETIYYMRSEKTWSHAK